MALNFVSALDLATIIYFFLLQVTKFLLSSVQYPKVDLLSTIDQAQSAFVYASRLQLCPFLKQNFFP